MSRMTTSDQVIDQMLRTGVLLGPYRPVAPIGMGRWSRIKKTLRRLYWQLKGI